MVIPVALSFAEVLHVANAGCIRQVQNLKLNREQEYTDEPLPEWQMHIEGCLGEYAFAKHMHMPWSGAFAFRAKDVCGYQIRTAAKHDHRLILHPDDKDHEPFVLVTGRNGDYRIQGWIKAADGKREEFWAQPVKGRPAFFVPQRLLRPIDDSMRRLAS